MRGFSSFSCCRAGKSQQTVFHEAKLLGLGIDRKNTASYTETALHQPIREKMVRKKRKKKREKTQGKKERKKKKKRLKCIVSSVWVVLRNTVFVIRQSKRLPHNRFSLHRHQNCMAGTGIAGRTFFCRPVAPPSPSLQG